MKERLQVGDVVQHFKREYCSEDGMYTYKILAFAEHTETKEQLVIYQALYKSEELGVDYGVYARPYDMFMSETDHEKYPNHHQKYRFEVLEDGR